MLFSWNYIITLVRPTNLPQILSQHSCLNKELYIVEILMFCEFPACIVAWINYAVTVIGLLQVGIKYWHQTRISFTKIPSVRHHVQLQPDIILMFCTCWVQVSSHRMSPDWRLKVWNRWQLLLAKTSPWCLTDMSNNQSHSITVRFVQRHVSGHGNVATITDWCVKVSDEFYRFYATNFKYLTYFWKAFSWPW